MKNLLLLIVLFAFQYSFAQKKGKLYPDFPEKFETPDAAEKKTYKGAVVQLKTGSWIFDQAIFGGTADRDLFKGKQAVRMQQNLDVNALLQMDFDLPNGASKVSFVYGSYYKDVPCTFILEYSIDQGKSWTRADQIITDASNSLSNATFKLDIKGNVRFRINKVGLGSSEKEPSIKNGRLNIDDFAVYQN